LGMKSAGFGAGGTPGAVDQPWGHERKNGKAEPNQFDNPTIANPSGRVHCTLDDMARYVIAHLEGETKGGLLKPETFKKLHTAPAGKVYACGWVVYKRTWAGGNALMHNGSNTFWYTVMWLAPGKDFAVIASTNIAAPAGQKACDDAVS